MKKLILLTIFVTFSSFSYLNVFSDQIKVISYNIRYNNPNDGKDVWENRRSTVVEFIFTESPDFIGMQEVTNSQLLYLNSNLSDHHYVGVGRDDGKTKGEYSPIFYNKSNYDLINSDTFWLSETPKLISVGWDASMERICTYGLFQQKTSGRSVWVFNTHFDHIGEVARDKSIDLILKTIKDLTKNNDRIIITGDFNLSDDSKPIKKIQNFYNDVNIDMDNKSKLYGTFNQFKINSTFQNRIDYIFYKNFISVESTHRHIKTKNGRWASDHHPVISLLKF